MSVSVSSDEEYGRLTRRIYTDTELRTAWHEFDGQGNKEARIRGKLCVVKECSEAEALALSRVFVNRFAIPTCCHYDGRFLSMYCGGAGGNFEVLHAWASNLECKERK